MQGKLTLVNPIKIDDKNVKQLKYDTNEITPELYAEAETRKAKAGHANGNRSGANCEIPETDGIGGIF